MSTVRCDGGDQLSIAVIGAGALGCLFGARLAMAGHEVSLIHYRDEYVEALNRDGVTVTSPFWEESPFTVELPATMDASETGPVDLVLVFLKAHQTADGLSQHAACIGPETRVLSLQNGMRHYETLVDHVGRDRALAGVTYVGAVIEDPGMIEHTGVGESLFGGTDESFAHRIVTAFEAAGLGARVVDDPVAIIWAKQLISLPIKPLAALTRLKNGELVESDDRIALMREIIEEAQAVADAKGIDVPQEAPLETAVEICRSAADHRSSMLQDVLEGRKTEIDEVNGAIAELGAEEGVAVPVNRAIATLVRGLERQYLESPNE